MGALIRCAAREANGVTVKTMAFVHFACIITMIAMEAT
jgi:hypothetical protein